VLLAAYAMGLLAVFFTGFYTFRMVFLTFHGEPRTETARKPHGVGWNVKFPLVVLGVLAAIIGFLNMVPLEELTGIHLAFLHDWLAHGGIEMTTSETYGTLLHDVAHIQAAYPLGELGTTLASAAVSLSLALAGVGLAWSLYNVDEPTEHTDKLGSLKTVLMHNYYQDEYQVWLATGVTYPLARAADKFDQGVVDGVVNGVSSVSLFGGDRMRRLQSGVVGNYATLITTALVVLLVAFGLIGGWF
jgi:NADH-quinone oxidoreductase subunit L